jgi:hypothetical protein
VVAIRLQRWSYLAGLVGVVLFVVGAILMFDGPNSSSPAKMTAWYGSGSHRTQIHVGWIIFGLGLFFFVWFVAALREQVSLHERAGGGAGGFLSGVVTIGGGAFVAAGISVAGIATGIKTMSDDTYHHEVYSGVIHGANDTTYQILVTGGGAALAALIFAVAATILGYGMLPRWTGWFGVIAGIAAIFSAVFFTMLVWLLWIAVISVLLFSRRTATATTTVTA